MGTVPRAIGRGTVPRVTVHEASERVAAISPYPRPSSSISTLEMSHINFFPTLSAA
jgi:hypothetical protein